MKLPQDPSRLDLDLELSLFELVLNDECIRFPNTNAELSLTGFQVCINLAIRLTSKLLTVIIYKIPHDNNK